MACPTVRFDEPPDLLPIDDQQAIRGDVVSIVLQASDERPADLTFTVSSSDSHVVSEASMSLAGSGGTRTLRITTDPTVTGSTTITATVEDAGGQTDSETFTFTVVAVFQGPGTRLVADEGAAEDFFGISVAVDGEVAVVGAYGDDHEEADGLEGRNAGSVYVFERVAGEWIEVARLTASDAAAVHGFGRSVSLQGDVTVVGAAGSAYVFERTGGVWAETAKLTASDGDPEDGFGDAVATDGEVIVVGAPNDAVGGILCGSASVFMRDAGGWTEQVELTAHDATGDARFGTSVALDGDTLLVGAPRDPEVGDDAGAAYVFTRIGGVWDEHAKLTASDGEPSGDFGYGVAVDGTMALVGTPGGATAGIPGGAAYVFTRDAGGWMERTKLTAHDAAADDAFGTSVALEGAIALVGAHGDGDDGAFYGSAYVFTHSAGGWTEQAKLTSGEAPGADWPSFGLAVDTDGRTAIVGAHLMNVSGSDEGVAFVFER
jgi:hypothetical protein